MYRERHVGTWGDIGCFSFYPGKNLGAYGDAGALTTADEKLATYLRRLGNHGALAKYDNDIPGRNSRIDNLQAAVLNVKMNHLATWIEQRRAKPPRFTIRFSPSTASSRQPWLQNCVHSLPRLCRPCFPARPRARVP